LWALPNPAQSFRHIVALARVIRLAPRHEWPDAKENDMSVTLLRQKVRDEMVAEAEAAVRGLFAALERARPQGLRYASTRVESSSTFVIMLELADGAPDPRGQIPEFPQFQAQLQNLIDGPPVIEQLEVIGSYKLFESGRAESLTQDA
jgi:hypothetical protein